MVILRGLKYNSRRQATSFGVKSGGGQPRGAKILHIKQWIHNKSTMSRCRGTTSKGGKFREIGRRLEEGPTTYTGGLVEFGELFHAIQEQYEGTRRQSQYTSVGLSTEE